MGEYEKRRSIVLRRVATGALTLEQATRVLNLSYRHMKRVWKRFRDEGSDGLAHKGKGRPSNRAFEDRFREEVLRRYRDQSPGMGPTRFAWTLAEHGIIVDHETLRRWLIDSGAWRLSRSRLVPRQAEPSARGFGELLTLVSMHECWLGPGLPPSFLLLLHDEGTSRTLCALAPEDSCDAAMRLLWAWIERHGLPAALRCPRRFVSDENRHPTLEQQLRGGESRTALAQACDRLGVDIGILNPPQAKAWIHDLNDIPKAVMCELGRRSAASMEEATSMLLGAAGDSLNRRFAHPAESVNDYHVSIVDGTDLRRFLCVDRVCRVELDGIVTFGHRRFRLMNGFRPPRRLPPRVVVSEWLDGSYHILDEGMELPFLEMSVTPCGIRRLAI